MSKFENENGSFELVFASEELELNEESFSLNHLEQQIQM